MNRGVVEQQVVARDDRPSIFWTGIVVFMLGFFATAAIQMLGAVIVGDVEWATRGLGELIFSIVIVSFVSLGLLNSVREVRSLAHRWDSMLAQPAMWTAALGSVAAFFALWSRSRPWESRYSECITQAAGESFQRVECVEQSRPDTTEAVLVLLALAILIAAFLAAAGTLIYTWRDMRPAL